MQLLLKTLLVLFIIVFMSCLEPVQLFVNQTSFFIQATWAVLLNKYLTWSLRKYCELTFKTISPTLVNLAELSLTGLFPLASILSFFGSFIFYGSAQEHSHVLAQEHNSSWRYSDLSFHFDMFCYFIMIHVFPQNFRSFLVEAVFLAHKIL